MEVKSMLINTIILFLSFTSCINQNSSKTLDSTSRKSIAISESFEEFYEKFHSDSSFQMNRIKFPLKGYNYDETYSPISEIDYSNYEWKKSEWEIHSKPIASDSLKVERIVKKEEVEEVITIPNSGTEIVRKFTLIDGKWFLVFYGNQTL